MANRYPDREEPCYVISVAAKMVGLNAQALRYYERTGLLQPSRSGGNIRLYSLLDIEQIRRIKTLIEEMGVNLAGAEVVLRLMGRIEEMERAISELQSEVAQLRAPRLRSPERTAP